MAELKFKQKVVVALWYIFNRKVYKKYKEWKKAGLHRKYAYTNVLNRNQ